MPSVAATRIQCARVVQVHAPAFGRLSRRSMSHICKPVRQMPGPACAHAARTFHALLSCIGAWIGARTAQHPCCWLPRQVSGAAVRVGHYARGRKERRASSSCAAGLPAASPHPGCLAVSDSCLSHVCLLNAHLPPLFGPGITLHSRQLALKETSGGARRFATLSPCAAGKTAADPFIM